MNIEYDIEKRILDRLSLWITDSIALCEMGNLSHSRTTTIVMRALLYALITGLIQKGANKSDFMEIVSTNYDMVHKLKSRLEG